MTPAQADPGPQPPWQRLKDRFVRFASEPGDPPEWQLRKSMGLALIAVAIMVIYLLYGAFYLRQWVRAWQPRLCGVERSGTQSCCSAYG